MLQSPEAPQDCQVLGLPGHLKKLLSSEFCKKLFSHILLKPPRDSNIPEIQNENFLWRLGILGPAEGIYLWVPLRKSRGCFVGSSSHRTYGEEHDETVSNNR